MRVVKIALSKTNFNKDSILGYFKKLRNQEALTEEEKNNLVSFANNINVRNIVEPILQRLANAKITGTNNLIENQYFSQFLGEILGENGFENVKTGVLAHVETIANQVDEALQDTPEAPAEVQEKTKQLQTWIENNMSYAGIDKIRDNVRVQNDGLYIKTSLGVKTLAWKGHTYGGVNTLGDNLKAQKYTIEEMGAIIEALGGKKPNDPLIEREQIGRSEISSFLSDIAGIAFYNFIWSSSERANNVNHAWGLGWLHGGVYVDCYYRGNGFSSWASQN